MAESRAVTVREMQIEQHFTGVQKRLADMALFGLHVVNVSINVRDTAVCNFCDVPLRISNSVDEAHFSRTYGFDSCANPVLRKPWRTILKRVHRTLVLDVIVGLGSSNGTGYDEEIAPTYGMSEGELAADVVNRSLAN